MLLPQAAIQGGTPGSVASTEAAVLVAVGLLGLVFLPQEREGDALPRQFLMHGRPVRHSPRRAGRGRTRRIQPGCQLRVIQLRR